MTQDQLYSRVKEIKMRVRNVLGGKELTHEFRGSQKFLGYTGTCLEVKDLYDSYELTEEAVMVLDEYANKVIELYTNEYQGEV